MNSKTSMVVYIRSLLTGDLKNRMFGYSDLCLPADSLNSASQAMSRLIKSGEVIRVFKGKFVSASFFANKESSRENDTIVAICNFRNKVVGYETGLSIWIRMGLLSQNIVIDKYNIATISSRPPQTHSGLKIVFLRAKLDPAKYAIHILQLLDAAEHYKGIVNISKDPVDTYKRLKKCFVELGSGELVLIADYALAYRPSTRALVGYILEDIGLQEYADRLRISLNPISHYSLNMQEKYFCGVSKWNIV